MVWLLLVAEKSATKDVRICSGNSMPPQRKHPLQSQRINKQEQNTEIEDEMQ